MVVASRGHCAAVAQGPVADGAVTRGDGLRRNARPPQGDSFLVCMHTCNDAEMQRRYKYVQRGVLLIALALVIKTNMAL